MNQKPTIQIWQQVDPRNPRPFKLVEVMITTDGCRSRFCDGSYDSFESAEVDRQQRIKVRGS